MMVEEFFETNNELISIENVSLVYDKKPGTVPAIEGINVNIYPGEFICVMGPSGCGKSTILNILAGFITQTSGSVKLKQKEIKGIDSDRGVVFQQPPLYEWFSVRKNIAFGPMMKKKPKETIKKDVEEYLEKVGLTEFADKKVYELSGGMKQRAAIASALINNPEIRKIWWNTGKTILFITHDVDEALLLGTRVLVMSKHPGKIIADIPSDFTKSFVVDNSDDIRYTEGFHQKRNHILQLINNQ